MGLRFGELGRRHGAALVLIWLVGLFGASWVSACENDDVIAVVLHAEGAWGKYEGEQRPLQGGESLCIGHELTVPGPGRVEIQLLHTVPDSEGAGVPIVNLGAHSSLRFRTPVNRSNWLLQLVDGWFRFFSPRPTDIDVEARYLTAGVRGTEFVLQSQLGVCLHIDNPGMAAGCDALWLQEGRVGACPIDVGCDFGGTGAPPAQQVDVVASDENGRLLDAGKRTLLALPGRPLELGSLDIHPDDAVNWVLYYPPLARLQIPTCDLADPSPEDDAAVLGCGRTEQILNALEPSAEDVDTGLVNLGVIRLVQAGEGEQALAALKRLAEARQQAALFALYSVIALKQGEIESADRAASQAIELDPDAAEGLLARSYVAQARFDIQGARSAAAKAARSSPDEPLIAVRMAELSLALDDSTNALDQARSAVRLAGGPDPAGCADQIADHEPTNDPILSRAWAVLGFTHLVRSEVDLAQQCFQTAIATDSLAPLPQLGLGLATVRSGKLDAGVKYMERAVALDPRVSLFRSYLAKGYLEQGQYELAQKELALAKAYDPADPTPWLYDAFLLQAQNRPVAAFDAIEESKSRNDNRAVYRSRLLLDEDLGTRQANLGRIYRELGFEKLALLEGSKSISVDPGNYAGHRLLADGYANQPRHEIARVSELLQAQLRQPVNVRPLQPRLTESDLYYRQGSGAGVVSHNEYTTLFNRDGTTIEANALAGTQDTLSEEVLLHGVDGRTSFGFSQYHYTTDGIRINNDLSLNLLGAFLQYRLTPRMTIQSEYRYRKQKSGDLQHLFDPNNFAPTLREEQQSQTLRFGFLYDLSSRSDVIGNVAFSELDVEQEIPDPFLPFVPTIDRDESGIQIELQKSMRFDMAHLIVGAGYYRGEVDMSIPASSIFDEERVRHANAYIYSPIELSDELSLIPGLSLDDYEGTLVDRFQLNPKLAAIWRANDKTTVRAAVFRALKRNLISNQTIEPATLAGFAQFYDDGNGTDVWKFGVGIDHVVSSRLNIGAEVTRRELDVPFLDTDVFTSQTTDIEGHFTEDAVQAYAYWRAQENLVFNAGYWYRNIEHDDGIFGVEQFAELSTHQFDFGLKYFLPSGWAATLGVNYIDQSGLFSDPFNMGQLNRSGDNFWIADAGVDYKFNRGRGSIGLKVRNLFDTDFRYQDIDLQTPRFLPELSVFGRVSILF